MRYLRLLGPLAWQVLVLVALFGTPIGLDGLVPRTFAQGIVITPNCIQPFDTLKVKSGGWPVGYLQLIARNPCFAGGGPCHLAFGYADPDNPEWTFQDDGKAFIYKAETFFDETDVGDYRIEIFQDGSFDSDHCVSIPFRIVADVGNPWQLIPKPCGNPSSPSCRPVIEMRFDPSLWCNTAACSKIRIVQAYRDSGVCGPSCFRILTNAEQGLVDGIARDETTVAGWTIDARGDDPNTPQINEEEHDPYMNGNDASDIQFTGHKVGAQGSPPKIAFAKDRPSTTLPNEPPADVTEFVAMFETNAFCSDGPIQGEWLGRVVWRWNKPRAGPATITIISTTRESPSQQFMDALRGWCGTRGFEWPRDDVIPTKGGTRSCEP